eukprot:m.1611492 g.1611492  ORF g.1611492 m.1611492 type:complete len:110 (-) comp25368_c0_seq19:2176-2505(-)
MASMFFCAFAADVTVALSDELFPRSIMFLDQQCMQLVYLVPSKCHGKRCNATAAAYSTDWYGLRHHCPYQCVTKTCVAQATLLSAYSSGTKQPVDGVLPQYVGSHAPLT